MKNFARAEEFVPRQISVVVAVHPLEPDRAARPTLLEGRGLGEELLAGPKELVAGADELDMEVPHRLLLLDARLAVALELSQRLRGMPHFPHAHAAVGISIEGHEESVAGIVDVHA